QRMHPLRSHRSVRTPQALALSPGPSQARLHALGKADALLLRNRREDRQHGLLEDADRPQVLLLIGEPFDAVGVQALQVLESLQDAFTGKAIERPEQDQVKLLPGGILE